MDDTTRSIIERITERYPQPQRLPSGHTSQVYFDCQRLTPNDLARLAAQAVGSIDHDQFDMVLGIAYNGILFAAAVAGGKNVAILRADEKIWGPSIKGKKILIVSDVVCSGKEFFKAQKIAESEKASVVGFACIIDRSAGKLSDSKPPIWSAAQLAL